MSDHDRVNKVLPIRYAQLAGVIRETTGSVISLTVTAFANGVSNDVPVADKDIPLPIQVKVRLIHVAIPDAKVAELG